MSSVAPTRRQLRGPVDITFVVRDAQGYILGSEVSSHLRHLSMVEFSYYLGYPVQQIAERESDLQASYINNNCSHLMYRLLYEYDGDDFFRQQHFTTLNWTPHSCYALHGWRQVMYANKLVSAYLAPVMRLGQIWAHWLLLRKCYIQSWWLKSENCKIVIILTQGKFSCVLRLWLHTFLSQFSGCGIQMTQIICM